MSACSGVWFRGSPDWFASAPGVMLPLPADAFSMPAIPIEAVTRIETSPKLIGCEASRWRMRSATTVVLLDRVSGSTMQNSSPP